jgi:hypothetical protein
VGIGGVCISIPPEQPEMKTTETIDVNKNGNNLEVTRDTWEGTNAFIAGPLVGCWNDGQGKAACLLLLNPVHLLDV